jgi:hypothetical protein
MAYILQLKDIEEQLKKGHRRAKFDLETNKNAWLVP